MLSETAKVTAVDSSAIWIEVSDGGSCRSCSVSGSCGMSLVRRLKPQRQTRIRVSVDDQPCVGTVQAGDLVKVEIAGWRVVQSALLLYLVPLLTMLSGAGLAVSLAGSEALSIAGGLLGLGAGLLFVRQSGVNPLTGLVLSVIRPEPRDGIILLNNT